MRPLAPGLKDHPKHPIPPPTGRSKTQTLASAQAHRGHPNMAERFEVQAVGRAQGQEEV